MNAETVVRETRQWISQVVIGLNLCPFARRVFDGGLIRYEVTPATDPTSLHRDLIAELKWLAATPFEQVETSFLIHPLALQEFLDYNDFVEETGDVIRELGLEGVIQIAGFHPYYHFAGTRPKAVENYTNRSPYPMLHILREESITRVNDDAEKLAGIPKRNIETMRRLGLAKVREMLGEQG